MKNLKIIKHIFLLTGMLLIFAVFIAKGQETYSIKGTISDEKGESLPGATAFLADTKKVAATDGSGKFILSELQPGIYELVIKMIGYDVYSQSIIIQKKSFDLHVKLREDNILLNTVTITALSDSARQTYLEIFTKYFLGSSTNAHKCKILNPEVIDFRYNKKNNILEASSEKFIIVKNEALGYNVHYLLTLFNLHMRKEQFDFDHDASGLVYDGSQYIEELKGTKSQQEQWEKNRQLSYEGSMWHFYRSAFNNTLKEDGFLIYRMLSWPRPGPEYLLPVSDSDSLFTSAGNNIKIFHVQPLRKDLKQLYAIYEKINVMYEKGFPYQYRTIIPQQKLYVVYTPKNEPARFRNSERHIELHDLINEAPRNGQVSAISPLLDSVLIDRNGNLNPGGGIRYEGFWTWDLAAGLLPPTYETSKNSSTSNPAKK
jgi:hypothetical protein